MNKLDSAETDIDAAIGDILAEHAKLLRQRVNAVRAELWACCQALETLQGTGDWPSVPSNWERGKLLLSRIHADPSLGEAYERAIEQFKTSLTRRCHEYLQPPQLHRDVS